MNPGMIHPIVQAMVQLAKMGVQIFVTTHDYFVQQEFNMLTVYPNAILYEEIRIFVSCPYIEIQSQML